MSIPRTTPPPAFGSGPVAYRYVDLNKDEYREETGSQRPRPRELTMEEKFDYELPKEKP